MYDCSPTGLIVGTYLRDILLAPLSNARNSFLALKIWYLIVPRGK